MLLSQYSANNFRVCTEAPSKAHVLFPPWLKITSNETQWEGTEFGVSRHEMSPGRSHLPNISEACLLVCFLCFPAFSGDSVCKGALSPTCS